MGGYPVEEMRASQERKGRLWTLKGASGRVLEGQKGTRIARISGSSGIKGMRATSLKGPIRGQMHGNKGGKCY